MGEKDAGHSVGDRGLVLFVELKVSAVDLTGEEEKMDAYFFKEEKLDVNAYIVITVICVSMKHVEDMDSVKVKMDHVFAIKIGEHQTVPNAWTVKKEKIVPKMIKVSIKTKEETVGDNVGDQGLVLFVDLKASALDVTLEEEKMDA